MAMLTRKKKARKIIVMVHSFGRSEFDQILDSIFDQNLDYVFDTIPNSVFDQILDSIFCITWSGSL